jgi:uncharacterized protein
MHFNVSQLMREPIGSVRSYEVDERLAPVDGAEPQPIVGTVGMLRTDRGVWVSAELASTATCTCSLCLEEHEQPVHIAVEEEFFPVGVSESAAGVAEMDDPAKTTRIDRNHILDLLDATRQYFALNVPMKPVCRSDCKGICPSCGAHLNETSCLCGDIERDSRWGPLLDLVPSSRTAIEGGS